jgi:sugar O-acyltransferase (sialic acid O-acetyltransferase NeuD family)
MNIIGSGGFGREVALYVQRAHPQDGHRFGVEKEYCSESHVAGLPLLSLEQLAEYKDAPTLIAVGDPGLREKFLTRLVMLGFSNFPVFIDPLVVRSQAYVSFGEGTIVTPYCILTTNVKVGRFVLINLSCTIGHDAVVEDFVTINPGCNISGGVHIGRGAQLGTGVKVIPNVSIGENAIIGAGAVVVRDIPPNCTAVGMPCKPIK